jgi:serine/threonine-protein kinase ATR
MDQSTGDTVHIDFACLFDKGLTLRQPEMVPFRLTQNVVDALGVAGVEGAFRRSCEVVLGVLRCHSGTILSVMDAFLHDPLVEWTQRKGKGAAGGAGPAPGAGEGGDNPAARDALATIEGRLRGTLLGVRSRPCMPLSVEGHAHRLILEAANKENLAILYLWCVVCAAALPRWPAPGPGLTAPAAGSLQVAGLVLSLVQPSTRGGRARRWSALAAALAAAAARGARRGLDFKAKQKDSVTQHHDSMCVFR